MTRKVYFDTNVFDHIYKRIGVSESDLSSLYSAVKTGKISVLLSIANLEETVSALASCPNLAKEELRLIIDLTDGQKLLKETPELLSDDIKSYARAGLSSQPFTVDTELQEKLLRTLQNPNRAEFLGIVEAIKKQKDEFNVDMREVRKKVLYLYKKGKFRTPHLSFDDFWETFADEFAERLAKHIGVLDTCKKRSIKGLLEVRSVRLCVGANLSLSYAQIFEKCAPDRGDPKDMHHAILASAADTFVTCDGKLAKRLSRISIEDFEVMDLNGLIKLIC